jgi:hypothetical protein
MILALDVLNIKSVIAVATALRPMSLARAAGDAEEKMCFILPIHFGQAAPGGCHEFQPAPLGDRRHQHGR